MSRTSFLQSIGATCNSWRSSWSFIDEVNKKIIFGAWEDLRSEDGKKVLILSDDWRTGEAGSVKAGYNQASEHIDKIIFEGYTLFTFKQVRKPKSDEHERASILSFEEELSLKYLERIGNAWFATNEESFKYTPDVAKRYFEGDRKEKLVAHYERNPEARKKCIDHHGLSCKACGFNFKKVYGDLGENYIHVHHKVKISSIKKRYEVDPINDLVPLCANCHAMIHIGTEMLTIKELQKIIRKNS